MKQFAKVVVDDRKLNMVQDAIVDALNPLLALPLSDANLLTNITLTSGSNTVNHGLGRKLVGWFIVRRNADASVYDAQSDNPMPQRTLTLVSGGTVLIDLMVF